jgi:hypothetical protein
VMEIVTRPRTGLFPEPAEISFRCSCPDWASMCKHVAAVLYGVGARLDREPEILFLLRGVDHRELIAAPGAADLAASSGMREKMIAEEDLAGIFGIEIDAGLATTRPARETPKRDKGTGIQTVSTKSAAPKRGRRPISPTSMEKPEPLTPKQGLRPKPPASTASPGPARPRRGRPAKPADSVETPEPQKRKRGRPRLTPKTGSADQAAPLPEEPKRERPKLRPAFIGALREEAAARKRREAAKAIRPQKKTVSRKGGAGRDATPAPVPIPTRRRGRPPGIRKA